MKSQHVQNLDLDLFLFCVTFNSQDHIAMGNLQVEEPMHSS